MLNFMRKTFTSLQTTTLYETGLLNLGLMRYQTAIEYFTQVIKLDSTYADAFYQRGIALRALGEQQKATSDFQKAMELNPKFLSDMLTNAMADMDFKLYQLAIEKFNQILIANPKLYKIFTQRALAKCALKMYKEAIQDFDEAIKLKPEERTYCDRGNAKAALGLYEEAMADYQQALQLNPQSTYALLNRGVTTYELRGRYYQALYDFKKVLELNSTHALALYHLGLVNFELGDSKNADLALERSIKITENKNAKNVNTYVMSGIVKLITDSTAVATTTKFEYACELINKKIAFDPSDIETKIELLEHLESLGVSDQLLASSIQENYGNLEKLEESINEANYPNLAALVYYYIARVYQINYSYVKAEETFLRSIKLEENSRVNYEYASLLIRQKKMVLAISKLQRALELGNDGKCITYHRLSYPLLLPSLLNSPLQEELKQFRRLYIRVSVLARWQLINCYIAVGEKSNAEQQLSNLLKAVEDFPTPLAYSLLGYACQSLKQWDLAARSFKTAMLLRANYSLAQQNLQKCLSQLSVQENDIEPFAIVAQIPQSLISLQNPEPVKHEQESAIQSTNPPLLSDKQQEVGKEPATERSKLNPTQHKDYQSVSSSTSLPETNPVKEIKSATYQEFYRLIDSSEQKLLKLPMKKSIVNNDLKSSEQKSETETALPLVPNISKEENEKEPDSEKQPESKLTF